MKKPKLWKRKDSVRDNLQGKLRKLAAEYFAAGRVALAPGTSWDEMHQFRLATKRFRYTLETFRDAYGPGLGARIEKLRGVQTFLGDINDLVVTASMVADNGDVVKALNGKAEAKTVKLRQWWATVFDAQGEERRWCMYLTRYACRPPRAAGGNSRANGGVSQ
ncbi:MAG TPA: CHAD domain-containing protein [Bryobacteraceae bacterium]|nr:CHAD domain-containing protein [Bryobacteraceae bacterium]